MPNQSQEVHQDVGKIFGIIGRLGSPGRTQVDRAPPVDRVEAFLELLWTMMNAVWAIGFVDWGGMHAG
jgi:hypothetical protein